MRKMAEWQKIANIGKILPQVLSPFAADYFAKLSINGIARKTGLPRRTVAYQLNKLMTANLVHYTTQGKNKLFELDLDKRTTGTLLNLIENGRTLKFQLETRYVMPIVDEILRHCESMIIFGSYAAGTQHETSDVDVVIVGRSNQKAIKDLKQKQAFEINEQYVSYDEFEHILASKNPLAIEILHNHIIFGNFSRIVDIFWRKGHDQK